VVSAVNGKEGGRVVLDSGGADDARQAVFVLGFHRGGATFVQRLLNCHQQVMIWGENGGMLSGLRLIHQAFAEYGYHVDADAFARFEEFATRYEPWVSPMDGDGLASQMGHFLELLYTADGAHSVWGFKEIRHGNPQDIDFLRQLFPQARLVLLVRQPRDLLNSQVHVAWSPAQSVDINEYVDAFTQDYLQTIAAFSDAATRWPDKVWVYSYEALRDREDLLPELFSRIGISAQGIDGDLVNQVRGARVGSSFGEYARSREVPPHEAATALARLDELLTSAMAESGYTPVRETLERLYPELDLVQTRTT
jgi:Sulfotransferase family